MLIEDYVNALYLYGRRWGRKVSEAIEMKSWDDGSVINRKKKNRKKNLDKKRKAPPPRGGLTLGDQEMRKI